MFKDVLNLYQFYQTPPGRYVQRICQDFIKTCWSQEPEKLLGMGYTLPLFPPRKNYICMMPSQQGAIHWPTPQHNQTALIDLEEIPLSSTSVDRIVVMHALEHTERPSYFLRELWRILSENGRIIFIVPNRMGFWAHARTTPFGYGSAYTLAQLDALLKAAQFIPHGYHHLLYTPPARTLFREHLPNPASRIMDHHFHYIFKPFAGLLGVEVSKQVYCAHPLNPGRSIRRSRLSIVPSPPKRTSAPSS